MAKAQPENSSGNSKKDEEDLTTILDAQQREDVTLLIANCSEAMRKMLTDNFDATAGLNKEFLQDGLTDEEKMRRYWSEQYETPEERTTYIQDFIERCELLPRGPAGLQEEWMA